MRSNIGIKTGGRYWLRVEMYSGGDGFVYIDPEAITLFRQRPGFVEIVAGQATVNAKVPTTGEMVELLEEFCSEVDKDRKSAAHQATEAARLWEREQESPG